MKTLALTKEEHAEKLDRELMELLNELRVALPGVQVMFAFLLTVPFAQRFGTLSATQRAVFFSAFLLTAAASILLMAPSAYHRLRWREFDKERMLRTGNKCAIGGLVALAGAIAAAVYLIGDVVYGSPVSGAVAAGVAVGLLWFWFGMALSRKR